MSGVAGECRRDGEALGRCERIAPAVAEGERGRLDGCRRDRQQRRAVFHQPLVRLAGAVPLEQGEFGMVQRAALAIAKHAGEGEDPRLACRQQPLAGELRRRVQVERRALSGRRRKLGRKGVQMGLVAGRDLQGRGLDLDEALVAEPAAHGFGYPAARHEERPPVGMDVRHPPGGGRIAQFGASARSIRPQSNGWP